jgi:hypothetical protein
MGESIRERRSRGAQGCTESIMVGEVSEGVGEGLHMVKGGLGRVAHSRKGSGKECTWSEGVQKGRRGVGEAMESSQGVSEVLGAGPGRDGS